MGMKKKRKFAKLRRSLKFVENQRPSLARSVGAQSKLQLWESFSRSKIFKAIRALVAKNSSQFVAKQSAQSAQSASETIAKILSPLKRIDEANA